MLNNILVLSSKVSEIYQVIVIIVVFIMMLFAAYYTTRFVGNMGVKRYVNSNMQIIEVLAVGPQKTLQLVRIGDQYYLIGVTKEQIVFLTKVEEDSINFDQEIVTNNKSFKQLFKDFSEKNKK